MANSSSVFNETAEWCLENAIQTQDGELLSGLWYVGVIMSICASCASNLGVNIQKFSMMNEIRKVAEIEGYVEKPYIQQGLWLAGLVLVILGAVGDFAALGFAAQTLATPVGGLTMVANVYFAHRFLKERLSCRDIFATVLVLLGVVLVAVSADKTEKEYSLDCLLRLYQRPMFIAYFVLIILLIMLLLATALKLRKLKENSPDAPFYRKWKKIHPLCPAALSGIIGSQSVLFAKCTAEMFKVTLAGNNQFNRWETYVIILGMVTTIFNQLHWLAHGLRLFDAVIIVPIFQCFFIAGGVIGGAVFFDEFRNLAAWEIITLISGVLTTIIGVFLLAQRDHEHPGEADAKVVPSSSAQEFHKRMSSIGRMESPRSTDKGSEKAASRDESEDQEDKPPMPMSLQYQYLAITDVYNAIRDGLATPEWHHSDSSPRRRASLLPPSTHPKKANLRLHRSEKDLATMTYPPRSKDAAQESRVAKDPLSDAGQTGAAPLDASEADKEEAEEADKMMRSQ